MASGKSRPRVGMITIDLFAFLTTEPNGVVKPIHPKALPFLRLTSRRDTGERPLNRDLPMRS